MRGELVGGKLAAQQNRQASLVEHTDTELARSSQF
jgi:hypothetical protein